MSPEGAKWAKGIGRAAAIQFRCVKMWSTLSALGWGYANMRYGIPSLPLAVFAPSRDHWSYFFNTTSNPSRAASTRMSGPPPSATSPRV